MDFNAVMKIVMMLQNNSLQAINPLEIMIRYILDLNANMCLHFENRKPYTQDLVWIGEILYFCPKLVSVR